MKKQTQNPSILEANILPTLLPEERELALEMSNSEMESLLLSMRGNRVWIAVIRYLIQRLEYASAPLRTLDPVKEPTMIARQQGCISGLVDLYNMVYILNSQQENATKK